MMVRAGRRLTWRVGGRSTRGCGFARSAIFGADLGQ